VPNSPQARRVAAALAALSLPEPRPADIAALSLVQSAAAQPATVARPAAVASTPQTNYRAEERATVRNVLQRQADARHAALPAPAPTIRAFPAHLAAARPVANQSRSVVANNVVRLVPSMRPSREFSLLKAVAELPAPKPGIAPRQDGPIPSTREHVRRAGLAMLKAGDSLFSRPKQGSDFSMSTKGQPRSATRPGVRVGAKTAAAAPAPGGPR
jgi:hypothetical protein